MEENSTSYPSSTLDSVSITQPPRVPFVYRYYFGIVMIFLSSTFIILQLFYLRMIYGKGGWRSEFAFTLLFILGLTDMAQLISHFLSGIFLTMDQDAPTWSYIPGAFLTAGWIAVVLLLCILTVHRFVWLTFPFHANRILSERVLKVVLFVFFAYMTFHIVCHLTWLSPTYFNPYRFIWSYHKNTTLRSYFLFVNSMSNFAIVLFNFPLYFVLFSVMYIRRKKVSRVKSHEIRITLQIFSFFVYAIICICFWEKKYDREKHPVVAFIGGLLLWVSWNGMKAVSAFSFNAYHTISTPRNGKQSGLLRIMEQSRSRIQETTLPLRGSPPITHV